MRRFLLYIIIGIGLTSCDVDYSDNGDLDGFWLLSAVDTLQTGKTNDLCEQGLTWAFEGKILEMRDVRKVHQDIILSFSHTGQTLKVYSPYLVDRENGDLPIEDIELLKPYGINVQEETFKIKELNGGRMTLESDQLRLCFRKY